MIDAGAAIIVVATVVAAVATSVSAYVSWQGHRGQIVAEWEWYWTGDDKGRALEVTPSIINETSATLQGGRIEADAALVSDVLTGNPPREKHESWPPNAAPLCSDVGPKKRQSYRVVVLPNWSGLAATPTRRLFRRSSSDALLRIQITLVSKSARRWRRKFSVQIPIPRQLIEKMASAAIS